MLVGTFYHTLEAKGRFSLPKTFRAEATSWVLTSGLDGCIFIFKQEEFDVQAAKLAEMSYLKADHRALIRHFAASASIQAPDEQGRLLIPENLQKMAGLSKNL
ncbi:cell division/cell wall cluster transcriptional repressor MraZ [bacterium]|nr:cell division/cell wall cluster transcriptional repressor MraZ [bacterium]